MLDRRSFARLLLVLSLVSSGSIASGARAQATQIKPRFLIVVDTSGSMNDAIAANSCGYAATKMGATRCAIKNILNSIGDAEFGLMQFAQPNAAQSNCGSGGTCDQTASSSVLLQGISSNNTATLLTYVDNANNPELCANGGTPLGGVLAGARTYFTGGSAPTTSDTAAACRPLNVILLTDGVECCGNCQPGGCPNAAADTLAYLGSAISCQTTCINTGGCNAHSETAPERAYELYNTTNVPTPSGTLLKRIKTYPIGFGVTAGDTRLENIAKAGHTNAPGPYYSNYATDEITLSSALNQIILESQLTEICNGVDDDCDTRVDEGYPKYCDLHGARTSNGGQTNVPACNGASCPAVPGVEGNPACAQPEWSSSSSCTPSNLLCADPGEICDQHDDDCDGKIDENAPAINVTDGCDLIDNDCDQKIDEDCNPNQCTPEICDGIDNNCVGGIDEGLSRQCGTDTGACSPAQQTCQNGQWGAVNPGTGTWQAGYCSDVGPVTELCNNIDDDCDGVIDHITRPCAPYGTTLECLGGVETCVAGVWQSTGVMPNNPAACVGARGPTTELCDGKDNDCTPSTADGSGDSRVGKACGNGKGICVPGTTACQNGSVVCNDPSEATVETCDGLDNDCDGKIDESTLPLPLPGVGDPCFPNLPDPPAVVGECRTGQKACVAGTLVCQNYKGPSAEICDTLDNDCNAQTPDGAGDPAVGQTCNSSVGQCRPGTFVCTAGTVVCSGGQGPVPELCDGADNDCDNVTDENLPDNNHDDVRDIVSCGSSVGLCLPGEQTCVALPGGGYGYQCVGGVGPVPEICDGADNDCDGSTDECESASCNDQTLGSLGAGGGQVCDSPLVVTANCKPGKTKCVANADGMGHAGFVCAGSQKGGVETCNGADDDCDTKIDEDLDPLNDPRLGVACGQNMAGTCRDSNNNPCGLCRFGTEQCVAGLVECIGTVGPAPYEKCNKADDDCDNKIDECVDPAAPNCAPTATDSGIDPNTPVGTPCGVNSGECTQGLNACVDGALLCQNSVGLQDELCNGKDDDCDMLIDEGFPIGAPCGSSIGECRPGALACPSNGMLPLDCVGGVQPIDEVCDTLDNDCDGNIDEGLGLGDDCGSNVGQCKQGKLSCVGGRTLCTGEIGPQPEICDCQDNDCDGKIDEESDTSGICPAGSACIMCQCALGCAGSMEFSAQCPQGKAAVTDDKGCFCVGEQCKPAECLTQTIKVNDEVQCAPKSDAVSACFCKNNVCTFRCEGVQCDDGLVCDPTDGRCKQRSCLLPQFHCLADQYCSLTDGAWVCAGDPCAGVNCAGDDACRDGECVKSCAKLQCNGGDRCADGSCVADRCATVTCDTGLVCNPDDGKCVLAGACVSAGCPDGQTCDRVSGKCSQDVCLRTHCPYGEQCNSESGQCELRCASNFVFCDPECVDPKTSRVHCGASDDCQGAHAGEACAGDLVCSLGTCSATCADKLLNCNGECIDPRSALSHCGAKDDCQGDSAGDVCAAGFVCMNAKCTAVDTGTTGAGTLPNRVDSSKRVIAAGGGGCACDVAVGGRRSEQPLRGMSGVALLVSLALLLAYRRRRLHLMAPRRVLPRAWLVLAVLVAWPEASSCKVDTFCLDCPSANKNTKNGGGPAIVGGLAGTSSTRRDSGLITKADASTTTPGDSGTAADARVKQVDAGCQSIELCNGIDDDCDGKIDEDADPAALNIDIKTNVSHCGGCGHACALEHAFNKCVAGACAIDMNRGDQGCDIGFINLDGSDDNGCEYRCIRRTDDDSACDLVDNDCDGKIDEDVKLDTDPDNCGSCGVRCSFPHAGSASACVAGNCVLDDQKCDEGYADVDHKLANGCEYHCPVWPTVAETCNAVDDDCNGGIDDDVSQATDARIGIACGSAIGACHQGLVMCIDGRPACIGESGPSREVCDGIDNDCDGDIDIDDTEIGLPCGTVFPGSQCSRGTLQIPLAGCHDGNVQALDCLGGQGPIPELCNGLDDDCDGTADEAENNVKPEEGQKCINGQNGLQIVTSDPPQWVAGVTLCRTGATVCESGNLACRNEVSPAAVELCDDLDQDCDGDPLTGFVPDVQGGTTATSGPDPRIGKSCGIDTGECRFGVQTCHLDTHVSSCDNQVRPKAEICNGKDDDCDGKIDETDASTAVKPVGAGLPCMFDSGGVLHYGTGTTAISPCVVGTTICTAGQVACPDYVGPTPELCDGIDQNCNGVLAEASFPADTRISAACDTDNNTTGVCNTGTQYCDVSGAVPVVRCQGEVFASAELCDGLDNDCNAATADGAAESWLNHPCTTNPDGSVNLSPAPAQGICRLGTTVCAGGIQQCFGEVGPQIETCDVQAPADLSNPAYDQNCNGTVDEDFQLQNNSARCGTCSNDCSVGQPHANMICSAGACQIASCKVGYYDDKRTVQADCSLHDGVDCTFAGAEVCDGKDNDCDGLVDENPVSQPLSLPAANQFCVQLGACAASSVQCLTHKKTDLTDTNCSGYSDPTCKTEPVCTIRPSPEVCDAPYNQETNPAYDNNCDGRSDSVEFSLNDACAATGVGAIGACATVGNKACDLSTPAATDTFCSDGSGHPVTVGTGGTETACNNIDDDCDGHVDEACGVAGSDSNCVTDAWVAIPNTTSFIYAYEASRRDATNSGSGTNGSRACSVGGRIPWGNLTWNEAEAACEATHPQGRLCSEAEWQAACEVVDGTGNLCAWSFASNCNTWVSDTCNGLAFVDSQEPEPTGWTGAPATSSNCYRTHSSANVFDQSGNMKEYTDMRANGVIPVRGGAYNNSQDGMRCNFNYTVWPDQNASKFPNVGFRCCRGPTRCVTLTNSTASSATNGLSSSIVVSGSRITSITQVAATIRGSNTDVNDLTFHLIKGATDRIMVNNSGCSNGTSLTFNVTFDSTVATAPTVSGACAFLSSGSSYAPSQAFSAFNGAAADGTWQFSAVDTDTNDTDNLTSWTLHVCGN